MQEILKDRIEAQRAILTRLLADTMFHAAARIALIIDNRVAIEMLLASELQVMRHCKHLYVLDADCQQITSNVTRAGNDHDHFGRNREHRGYMQEVLGGAEFSLSDAYISKYKRRPSITAMQLIRNQKGEHLGYLGADYDLRELPHSELPYRRATDWQQMRGDPSIRQGLFQQLRSESVFDRHIDEVLANMAEMIVEQGVFHGKLHFSSSRATLWLLDDPYSYQVLGADEMLDADLSLAYPSRPWSERATVMPEQVPEILELFKVLRFADENIYLRSGSINVINGMIGLNFSCDGTHYMQHDEFLGKDSDFWFGKLQANAIDCELAI